MLGICTNHFQPPHSCNMGLPIPPSQFTEEETEAQGGESSASGHPAGRSRARIGSGGVLHPISISPTELSPLSWKDRAWTFSITDLHPSLPNNTYPIPLLHNVTITVAERMGPCRIMSCRLSWDASFPQRSQPRSAVEGTWRSGSGLWFHLKKAMPQRVRGLSKPMSPEETKPTP
jgi:hypothetical protein